MDVELALGEETQNGAYGIIPMISGGSPTKPARSTGNSLYGSTMIRLGSWARSSGVSGGTMRAMTVSTKPICSAMKS